MNFYGIIILKSYLSNPSRIFHTDALEVVLWLVKRVYFFYSPGTPFCKLAENKAYTHGLEFTVGNVGQSFQFPSKDSFE